MEFLELNQLQTSTQIAIDSGTLTSDNLFDWDIRKQYSSDGFADDNTTASITISFDQTTTIDRLFLLETNVKGLNIFYDGVTANTFSFTTTAATTTSQFTNNSETSMFFACTSVNCTSVSFDLKATQSANVEKAVGYIGLCSNLYTFERIPSAKNYKPSIFTKQNVHKLSDGGTRIQKIQRKKEVNIKFKHIEETFRDGLYEVYKRDEEFLFVAFPTSTSWDQFIFECVWDGDFNFFEYTDNADSAGFSGAISLKET